jgi:hypothetical protein
MTLYVAAEAEVAAAKSRAIINLRMAPHSMAGMADFIWR